MLSSVARAVPWDGGPAHPHPLPAHRSYQRVFETVKAVNQAAKARSCSESPHHVPGSKQLSAAHSGGASTPHTNCSGSEDAR